jgi:hypothetical protein
MRVGVWYGSKGLDDRLASAFAAGVRAHGDTADLELRSEFPKSLARLGRYEAVYVFGVKAREQFTRVRDAGVHTVYFDKGYIRTQLSPGQKECRYWRVAVDAHHPTSYVMKVKRPRDRWDRLGITPQPWRKTGHHIIYAGSSAKYHSFNGLIEPTEYARSLVEAIRGMTDRPIIYRPKPSWQDAVPVDGASFSRHPERLDQLLPGAHCLITNGSNSCFEAVIAGIPCIILGDAVAAPLSSKSITDLAAPLLASKADRDQWLWNLAYCQWSMAELASGEAWGHIKEQIDGL